jgi:hypothetical protein
LGQKWRNDVQISKLTAGLLPLAVWAQQATIPVIGYHSIGAANSSDLSGLRKGLNELGFAEGHNVALEFRNP